MAEENISTRECAICRKDLDGKDSRNERGLEKHSAEIAELSKISGQLTQLMKLTVETQNKMDKRLETLEKQYMELQIEKEAKEKAVAEQAALEANRIAEELAKKPRWYETDIAKWSIKMLILLLIFIIGAAIGQDLMPDVLKLFKS